MFDYAWNGKSSDEVRSLVRRQLIKNLNEKVLTGPLYKALVLSGQSKKLDDNTLNILEEKIGMVLLHPGVNDKLLLPVRDLMAERMAGMAPEQFQGLLMPIFEEDQWILIFIGGILGFLAGLAQLVFMFGGSLFT